MCVFVTSPTILTWNFECVLKIWLEIRQQTLNTKETAEQFLEHQQHSRISADIRERLSNVYLKFRDINQLSASTGLQQ